MSDDALRARFARSPHTPHSPSSPGLKPEPEPLLTLALGRGLTDEMIYYASPHHAYTAQTQGLTAPGQGLGLGLVADVTAFDHPGEYPLEVIATPILISPLPLHCSNISPPLLLPPFTTITTPLL